MYLWICCLIEMDFLTAILYHVITLLCQVVWLLISELTHSHFIILFCAH